MSEKKYVSAFAKTGDNKELSFEERGAHVGQYFKEKGNYKPSANKAGELEGASLDLARDLGSIEMRLKNLRTANANRREKPLDSSLGQYAQERYGIEAKEGSSANFLKALGIGHFNRDSI